MRTGIAYLPLDTGRCPAWLFEKMKRLCRGIILGVIEEFGPKELLKRFADPIWFQSLSAVIGMDWNSSGTTTITLGAIKSGIFEIQKDLGFFICGGKKVSRKTPDEIQNWSENLGWEGDKAQKLIYASKMAAKVDSCLIQNIRNSFQLYHHNFLFNKTGQWCVIQQGMAPELQKARRYHWLSSKVSDFTEEPQSAIVSDIKLRPLNLVAKRSKNNKKISTELVKEEPRTFLKDIVSISEKSNHLMRQKRLPGFVEMELNNIEFYWHPILREKFNFKRLRKTIFFAHEQNPQNFETLLSLKGVGPKTIRALSLVSEIIYGAKPSYEDPARYSFAHGGKDGTPYFIEKDVYDKTLEILEKGIKKAKMSSKEKDEVQKNLKSLNLNGRK